jgi:hypothetical protein
MRDSLNVSARFWITCSRAPAQRAGHVGYLRAASQSVGARLARYPYMFKRSSIWPSKIFQRKDSDFTDSFGQPIFSLEKPTESKRCDERRG